MIQVEKTSILIVDDEPLVLELLRNWFLKEGHLCQVTSSGEDALELLAAHEFHLVVCDIKMPGMSGIELLKRIKVLFPDIAVLMATSVNDRETAIMTLRLGAYGYVIKPFDRTELLINVVNALERRRMTLMSREHERALEAKIQANEKYGKLVRHFPYGIAEFAPEMPIRSDLPLPELLQAVWNARLTDANMAFAAGYGYARVQDLLGASLGTITSPDANAVELFAEWIANGFKVSSLETTENGANPDPRYFENTLMGFVRDGQLETFWAIRRDVTERTLAQETIRQQGEFLNTILASLTHPVYVVNAHDYVIEKANPVAQALGFTEKNTCYSAMYGRSVPCNCSEYSCPVSEIKKTGQPFVTERVHNGGNGKPLHLEIHACPILDSSGNVAQIVESCVDVSDRKTAQDLLIQTEKFKAVADLTAGVAHNFNNLLQVIMGNAQVALLDLAAKKLTGTEERLVKIVENCRLGAETVRRLRQFSTGGGDFKGAGTRAVDLSDLVRQATAMTATWVENLTKGTGICVSVDLDLEPGCFVKVNEGEFFEVLVNLIKNAVEAMPQGGVIQIVTIARQEQVVLTVQDTGVGIPQDVVHRLFTPFFTTKHGIGTGLGLATSRGIVGRHGGQMLVESTVGRGTVFTILLPFAKAIPKQASGDSESVVLRDKSVLVIDDMEPVVSVVTQGLSQFGYTVFPALSGEEGMEIFMRNPVDLVICDLGMPGMTGWDVGEAIKDFCERNGVPKPPFIVLTGWGAQSGEEDRMSRSGVDAIVEKPVHVDRLVQVIGEMLA